MSKPAAASRSSTVGGEAALREALERLVREAQESLDIDPYYGPSEEAMEQARAALQESAATASHGSEPDTDEWDAEDTQGAEQAGPDPLLDALGSLHVIDAHAGMIERWIGDPNLDPVAEAKKIRVEREKAHNAIVAALRAAEQASLPATREAAEPGLDVQRESEAITLAAEILRFSGGCEKGHRPGQPHVHIEVTHRWGQRLAAIARRLRSQQPASDR